MDLHADDDFPVAGRALISFDFFCAGASIISRRGHPRDSVTRFPAPTASLGSKRRRAAWATTQNCRRLCFGQAAFTRITSPLIIWI